jgi:hypothetical protein
VLDADGDAVSRQRDRLREATRLFGDAVADLHLSVTLNAADAMQGHHEPSTDAQTDRALKQFREAAAILRREHAAYRAEVERG